MTHRKAGVASAVALAAVCTALLAACTPAEEPAARQAAEAFQTALANSDGSAACALLSDEARGDLEATSARACPEALRALNLPAGSVQTLQVWGGNSQVRLESGVLFLAQFTGGWKVTAAGCTPRTERPYNCRVEG